MEFKVLTKPEEVEKKHLVLLLRMLNELGDFETLKKSAEKYGFVLSDDGFDEKKGYNFDKASWDDDKLAFYKSADNPDPAGLSNRMKKGYTFFTLEDKEGHVAALASGNAFADKTQLRVLNFVKPFRFSSRDTVTELAANICNWAHHQGFNIINAPLSENALKKGRDKLYDAIAKTLNVSGGLKEHETDPTSRLYKATPREIDLSKIPSRATKPDGRS